MNGFPKRLTIGSVVKEIIEGDCCGSRSAIEQLIEIAQINHEIHNILLRYGADQAVRDYYHGQRKVFSKSFSVKEPKNQVLDAERSDQKMKRRLFWDRYALFGHMQLKTATRPHLSFSIENRKVQAEGNLRCAAFEQDIMDRMGDDKITVGKRFKSSEIVAIAESHSVI